MITTARTSRFRSIETTATEPPTPPGTAPVEGGESAPPGSSQPGRPRTPAGALPMVDGRMSFDLQHPYSDASPAQQWVTGEPCHFSRAATCSPGLGRPSLVNQFAPAHVTDRSLDYYTKIKRGSLCSYEWDGGHGSGEHLLLRRMPCLVVLSPCVLLIFVFNLLRSLCDHEFATRARAALVCPRRGCHVQPVSGCQKSTS